MPKYLPRVVEPRWQRYWAEHRTFRTPDPDGRNAAGPKYYILDMFPYPSGAGLHVGHPEGYTATDILARFKRMNGFHVLHPMGWDAFGLPAEQHAIKTGEHPASNTKQNVDNFRRQIQALGFSYDWEREVDTTDPDYVKWTQWIFLVIYDTWYDKDQQRGRPISELPIPNDVIIQGDLAVRKYRDSHRLAYQAEVPVNWCPAMGTVLSNEEVIDGKSEVGDHPVIRMPLRQWLLRITAYADRLGDDLEPLGWPASIKKLQRDWIGRSEGAEVEFSLIGGAGVVRVFTTRPDTLFGATYMVLAPEHPLVESITTEDQSGAVRAYREQAARKSDRDRTDLGKLKTGVFTGAYAINPVNNEKIPVWIADYVLAGYGTGAIMAVPAHDERDFDFAKQFHLPIVVVVQPPDAPITNLTEPFIGMGVAVNSGPYNGLTTAEFKSRIIAWLELKGLGKRRVNYALRDWLFSRQRYWGEPFPILHEIDANGERTGVVEPLSVGELPLRLPEMEDFKPTGSLEGPLAKATDWVEVTRDGKRYRRETNTMPQWAGSCWYFLRYIDPKNPDVFADADKLKYWLPVDLYVGGAEHAVLHLLYSRFWHKVLFDRGYVPTVEPFGRLVNQGMILGETEYHIPPEVFAARKADLESAGAFGAVLTIENKQTCVLKSADGSRNLPDERIEKKKGKTYLKSTDVELTGRAEKMSKSRGNVINPDDVISEYGADSLRLYEMFMGPLEATKPWNMLGVEGVNRFLGRVWRLIIDDATEDVQLNATVQDTEPDRETLTLLHRTIQKVTEDTEAMRFNTAIASMMEFTNHLTAKVTVRPRKVLDVFVLLLAPYAPHVAEELWRALGHLGSLAYEPWPVFDPALTKADTIEIPVQVNGKVRAKLTVAAEITKEELESLAMADEAVRKAIEGKEIKKVVVVPKKMVSIAVG